MDYFSATRSPSPSPELQLPETPKAKKGSAKITPSKVTKRGRPASTPGIAGTPPSARGLKNSPVPKTKAEIQPYDQLVLDLRAANPPTPWKEIEVLYREAGGITTGAQALKNNRYPLLKAAAIEVTSADTKAEIQPYDQLVLDLRARNPPTPWKEIETLYRDAGGITTGHLNLKVRIGLLEALEEEMTETEQAVEEEFQKQVWGLVAEKLKVEKGREWNAKFLKNTCDGLKKGTL
ncbi:hypothetical protein M7I_0477 [Glarea lozoyensis 74030]|uniref:Uncharacterized protein n=1 Tax=Glarea lozoyensis (strain ATCC 74030 / MF5533) TaxID=1104152 RepID=H0EDM2_GLAL7|nr:hypothetical protein M7I_0477 [Glarea lozoyensis 74030]